MDIISVTIARTLTRFPGNQHEEKKPAKGVFTVFGHSCEPGIFTSAAVTEFSLSHLHLKLAKFNYYVVFCISSGGQYYIRVIPIVFSDSYYLGTLPRQIRKDVLLLIIKHFVLHV